MNIKSLTMSLLLASALFADQQPINQTISEQLNTLLGTSIKVSTLDEHSLMINNPIESYLMIGGGYQTKSDAYYVQSILERNCLAYGGDVYFEKKDKFGDTVLLHSFNQDLVGKMSPQEKKEHIKLIQYKESMVYKLKWSDISKKLFTDDRLRRSFILDTDELRQEGYFYNAVCKDPTTDQILYTANNKMINGHYDANFLIVNFKDKIAKEAVKHSQTTKTLEDVYAGNIEDQKGNKILLKFNAMTLFTTNYAQSAKEYCDLVGGSTMVDTRTTRPGEHLATLQNQQVACVDTQHPFTLKFYNGNFIISKDTTPIELSAPQSNTGGDDVMRDVALSVSSNALGSTTKKQVGGRNFIATVYSNRGGTILVHVLQKGNASYTKNYQIINGVASDITDPNETQASIAQLPQRILNSKRALDVECSINGSSQLTTDGYSASCVLNPVGYFGCTVTMIYTKGNQYAGGEMMGCLRK